MLLLLPPVVTTLAGPHLVGFVAHGALRPVSDLARGAKVDCMQCLWGENVRCADEPMQTMAMARLGPFGGAVV